MDLILHMDRVFKLKTSLFLAWITVLVFSFLLSLSGYAENVETYTFSGKPEDPNAIKRVLAGEEKEANAGWWGFNSEDATEAIQGAIDSGACKVIIPYVGRDWVVQPIQLASNQEIIFEPGVVVAAKKGAFQGKDDCLFSAVDKKNITLRGYNATLRMRKEDYKSYRVKSEHRHVLAIRCSENITVLGLRLENAGGDGIYLGAKDNKRNIPCENILIKDCYCGGNFRQGISVISADKLRIENCVLSDTKGTRPQAGIDIEPSHPANMLADLEINDCIAKNNQGTGFAINLSRLKETSMSVSIRFNNCYVESGYGPGFMVFNDEESNRPKGKIEFANCVCRNTVYPGGVVRLKASSPLMVRFINCKFKNVATRRIYAPLDMVLKREKAKEQGRGVEFIDCHVYDDKNRPFIKVSGFEGDDGVYDIKGDINVHNSYGAKADSLVTNKELPLQIHHFKSNE